MKKLLTVLSVMVLVGFIGYGPAIAKTAKEKAQIVKRHTITGEVVSVDAIANKITIKDDKGEQTIPADAETNVTVGGKPAILSDIKAGAKITLIFKMKDKEKVAAEIKVVK